MYDRRMDAMGRETCPLCGSASVRWRGRRPYDVPLTWLRYVGELVAGAFLSRQGAKFPHEMPGLADEYREAATGHKTPRRFWRCSACQQKGHEF